MKNTLTLMASALLLAACQQIDLGDKNKEVAAQDGTYSVKINSKSGESGADIPKPLTVYAVNADGLVETKASVTDEEATSVNLSLLSGDFTFYAIAGADAGNDDVPANNIVTADEGSFANPIMRCEQNATIDDDMELPLTLSYAVAAVDVTLSNIPADVKAMSVKMGSLRESLNIEGEYAGTTTATLNLEKQSDGTTWKSATAYVFPSVSAPTTLTITQTMTDDSKQSYSASYNAKLLAGTPYHFSGTGTNISNHELTINVTTEGWDNAIVEELVLTPIGAGDGSGSIDTDGETYLVSEMPTEAGVVLDGKHVLICLDTENSKGLLFSRNGWSQLSPNSADIQSMINDYSEDGVTGWSMPTEAQVEQIFSAYDNKSLKTYQAVNSALTDVSNGVKLAKYDNTLWFLCENAEKKYSFYSGKINPLSDSDIADGKFYLRLVKQVTFKLKD